MTAVAVLSPEQLADLLEQAAEKGARRALEHSAPSVLSTEEAARYATAAGHRVSAKTVREWISSGALPAGRRGARRTIRREDLDRYLAGKREAEPLSTAEIAASLVRKTG